MSNGRNRLVLALLLGTALLGCNAAPRFHKNFGTSVRANLSAQTLDPAAAADTSQAAGMDGATARVVHERYQRSFKEPAPSSNQGMIGASGQ